MCNYNYNTNNILVTKNYNSTERSKQNYYNTKIIYYKTKLKNYNFTTVNSFREKLTKEIDNISYILISYILLCVKESL